MVVVFVFLVEALAASVRGPQARWRWQLGASAALVATVVAAAWITWVLQGSAWGFPLADVVWWFDVVVMVEQLLALLVAAALGTPGCEIGVWPELLARVRGESPHAEEGFACIVGLHVLDRWEAGRRERHDARVLI